MTDAERARLWTILYAVLLCAAALALHLYLLDTSPFLDEGDHATTGRLLARGGAMYRDAFNEKGPGLYWLTALLFRLGGDRFALVRHAATAGMLLTIVLLIALGWRLGRRAAGLVAATLFVVFHLLFLGRLWQSESVLTPLCLALAWLLIPAASGRKATGRCLAAGLCLFVMTAVKQTAWLAVVVALATLVFDRAARRPEKWRGIGLVVAGLLVPWGAVLAGVAAQGTTRIFLDGYLFPLFGFRTLTYVDWPEPREALIQLPLWWMVIVSLALPRWVKSSAIAQCREARWLLVGAILMISPAWYMHHFLPVLALAALCFSVLWQEIATPRRRAALALGAVLLAATAAGAAEWPQWWRDRVGTYAAARWTEVARAVDQRVPPGQPILAFPHDSSYYYLTDRYPPGRFGFFLPWTSPPEVIDEALRELTARPPAAILYVYFANGTPVLTPRAYLAPVLDWIARRYRIEQVFPNRVVMLTPRRPDDTAKEECRVRSVLYADFPGWEITAEVVARRIERACP